MSKQLELPDGVYDALVDVAEASGTTPAEWIARRVESAESIRSGNGSGRPLTLGELLKCKIGVFRSGKATNVSERVDELFGDYLQQKRKEERP
jgi:hypothetical protein